MSKTDELRLDVRKMYKLYINGAFVRSESGRSDPIWDGETFAANVARASRKDVRDAVVAARAAQIRWSNLTPANRGLILYRLAEMLEARRHEFLLRLREGAGASKIEATREIDATIDRTVWYAGWCDKYAALLSSRNPVSGPHLNLSAPEPMGVVAVVLPDRPALLALVSTLLPPLVAGNAIVALASERDPRTAVTFSEALATSDLPGGALNLLTGLRDELVPTLAKHMDIDAIELNAQDPLRTMLEIEASHNVKRVRLRDDHNTDWYGEAAQSLERIERYCEIKTIWHPAGI